MNLRQAFTITSLQTDYPARCRPGLRYGSAPERSAANKLAGYNFSVHFKRLSGMFRTSHEQRFSDHIFSMLECRIGELNSVSTAARKAEFESLRLRILREGYDDNLLSEALAYVCVLSKQVLLLSPREGQCRAAIALLFGRFVEMPTGEGKTLATALAAAVMAIDGTPVHVLTANDYLAERDANLLDPLYTALGLTSGFVRPDMNDSARRAAYDCDITHLTGKQAGFDWMRDALLRGPVSSPLVQHLGALVNPSTRISSEYLQRGLCAAILDEADSMLLDEARTPLVLAAPLMARDTLENEASVSLALAQLLSVESDFQLRRETREVTLTETGKKSLERLAQKVPGAWRAKRYRNERVRQALIVLHLWQRDHDYVVRDGQVLLVDEQSGRALPDRRLQNGLHSLLELKERCKATPESQTVASIAFQSFFRRYVRLVGTSGTLQEVRSELSRTYGASMVCVSAHKPLRLTVLPTRVFISHAEQLDALIEEVRDVVGQKRPVLIGTRSVEQSGAISAMLAAYAFKHNVLDASQDSDEATIVAEAGQSGRITVATNMAGRGTDIPLGPGVARLGGLHVVSLAFNDARRIDRQLVGRTARQGEPGSFRQLWTLEDTALKMVLPSNLTQVLSRLASEGEYSGVALNLLLLVIRLTQRRIEWHHSSQRKAVRMAGKGITNHIALDGYCDHPV
ncbi:MAG: hypothetical protein AB8B87_23695 [Granulosicoccus sp.]